MGLTGQLVPMVLIPKFTSYFGASSFPSGPIEASQFGKGTLVVVRGPLLGTSATMNVYIEEATASGVNDSYTASVAPPPRWSYSRTRSRTAPPRS